MISLLKDGKWPDLTEALNFTMKIMYRWVCLCLFAAICLTYACQSPKELEVCKRMQQWDNAMWDKTSIENIEIPRAILDSLASIDHKSLSNKTQAYYHLLETIARDKSYYVFPNDSTISLAVKWYKNKSDTYNYCRSLFYHAIVLSRTHSNDSLMFFSIKTAENTYLDHKLTDSLLYARMCLFLGSLYYDRENYNISRDYYIKASDIFKAMANADRYVSAKRNQAWCYLSTGEYEAAYAILQELDKPDELSQRALSQVYNTYCGYYTAKKEYSKAIEYNKLDFSLKNVPKSSEDTVTHYYSLIQNYCKIGQTDSATHYAGQLQQLLHSNNPNNHFYYLAISKAYREAGLESLGLEYLSKAYYCLRSNIYHHSQQRILELEKKYDLSRKEFELMQATQEKKRLLVAAGILLLIIIAMAITIIQHKQLLKQKALLIQEEKEHFATVNVLQRKALNLYPKFIEIFSIFHQEHYKMEVQEDLNRAVDVLKSKLIGELSSLFPAQKDKAGYEHLSEKEYLVFLLTEYNFSNEDIANFLLITEANVRSTKSKIKRKSETF